MNYLFFVSNFSKLIQRSLNQISISDINYIVRRLIVNNAKTKFTYGMTNIDNASVYLNLTFKLSGKTWTKEFSTKQNDSGVKDANMTSVVEYAWDQIALDVAREVAKHL